MKKKSSARPRSEKPKVVPGKRTFANSSNIPRTPRLRLTLKAFYKDNRRLLFIVLIFFIVAAFAINYLFKTLSEAPTIEIEAVSFLPEDGEVDTDIFLNNFLLQNTGTVEADRLQSIRLSGTIQQDGQSLDFYMIKRRPDQAILRLTLGRGLNLTYGVKGNRVWSRLIAPDQEDKEEIVTGDTAVSIASMGRFFSPLIELAIERRGDLQSIEHSEKLGYPTIAVTFHNAAKDTVSEAHLSHEDLAIITRFDYLPDGSVFRGENHDNQVIKGFRFPFRILNYMDDTLQTEIQIDSLTPNPGVISDLFDLPESLR